MKWNHEERKAKLMEVCNRDSELNEKAGGIELFQSEFVDYTDEDVLIMKYYIKPWQRNPFGNLQGGMICYYMDATAGGLSWVTLDCEPIGTVDINVNFIRAVDKDSDYIIVKSKVISIGRRVVVAEVKVFDKDGWLMAVGMANTARMLPADPNPTIVK